MTYYIVSGRIPYDDEDTLKVIEGNDINEVSAEFKRQMLEEGEPTEEDEDGPVVYVNYVIRCGSEKPEIEWMNY